MDGLMFDTENLFVRAFEEAIGPEIGYRFSREKMKQLIGLNHQAELETFPQLFPGCPAPCEACLTRFRAWMQEYIRENGIPVKPGLRTLLAWLKEQGVSCAVATSTDTKVAKSYLENAGITAYFQTITGGDQVTRSKPDPEIFHLAMRALGQSEPAKGVVFEDSRNGLLAGARGGFSVLVIVRWSQKAQLCGQPACGTKIDILLCAIIPDPSAAALRAPPPARRFSSIFRCPRR